MWAYPTREEVGWFFDEQINQTVFKRGKLSSKVQARFEEIGKWLRVHCEPQIMELEKRMDAMLREREVKSLRAKPRKVKNLGAKLKRPVNIKKDPSGGLAEVEKPGWEEGDAGLQEQDVGK